MTGSTSGLGRVIADAFATEGAHVVLTGRPKEAGERAGDEPTGAGHRADFVAGDLAEGVQAATRVAEEAEHLLGQCPGAVRVEGDGRRVTGEPPRTLGGSTLGPLAVYLASADAAWVHGSTFTADGGWSAARRVTSVAGNHRPARDHETRAPARRPDRRPWTGGYATWRGGKLPYASGCSSIFCASASTARA